MLETKRLFIRPIVQNDIEIITEILSDPKTMTFFVEGTYSKKQVEEIILHDQQEHKHYAIVLKETGNVIGKFTFNPWFMDRTYEIGWIMHPNYTNQGYAFEAASQFLEHGFTTLGLHRIIATCQPENIPSKKLCEKLQMRLEGTFKQCIHVKDDIWWDELFYAILQEEYKKE